MKIQEKGIRRVKVSTEDEFLDELYELLNKNTWYEWFESENIIGNGWIDFEAEISRIIVALDSLKRFMDAGGKFLEYQGNNFDLLRTLANNKNTWKPMVKAFSIDSLVFIKQLENDLDRIIRALEIYLTAYVSTIPVKKKLKEIDKLDITHVLSFNYTDTYRKCYGHGKDIEYDYIHGVAKLDDSIDACNMVLGIDEYLTPDMVDKDTTFIAFKKFYQRIYKGNGAEYLDWLDEIRCNMIEEQKEIELEHYNDRLFDPSIVRNRDYDNVTNLYIFGHSLNVTDADVLKSFICNDNVQTHIFYHRESLNDREDLKKKVANFTKVIGPEKLIRRTGGPDRTIEFIAQEL